VEDKVHVMYRKVKQSMLALFTSIVLYMYFVVVISGLEHHGTIIFMIAIVVTYGLFDCSWAFLLRL
jgi:hypothetical protein